MTPITPEVIPDGTSLVVFGRKQPQYIALPAVVSPSTGLVMTEWQLTAEELAMVLEGGRVRLWVWTFNTKPEDWEKHPFRPVALEVVEAP